MATEIERKFLVHSGKWKPVTPGLLYRQGYLSSVKERVVRVRIAGEKAYFTVKGISENLSRLEFEYPIPLLDAAMMLDKLCERPLIEKTRHREIVGSHTWEIDVFHGENNGLVLAEVEVASETETFERPSWLAQEVSGDPRYFNNNLVRYPFRTWRQENWRE
jgi:adenylate cyclase